MKSNWSKGRIVAWCVVLVFLVVMVAGSLMERGSGGFGLTLFCLFAVIFFSVVGIIDTCVLIFRGVWDQVTPGYFFNAFVINISLFALMWFFLVASFH